MATSKVRIIRRSQGPSQDEWERIRPVVERLYKHENKTENEVRRILLEQHDMAIT